MYVAYANPRNAVPVFKADVAKGTIKVIAKQYQTMKGTRVVVAFSV